jgi:hypothetical protein
MPTQETNIYNPTGPAIQYSASHQTWKIAKQASVGSGDSTYAIYSTYNNSKLINKGYVYAYGNSGVFFTGDNATFVNKASGIVSGLSGALSISSSGDSATILNYGRMYGGQSGIVSSGPGDLALENHGEIYGHDYGILIQPTVPGSTPGPHLLNDGKISGDGIGIFVNNFAGGMRTKIVNDHHGVIKGSTLDGSPAGAAIWYLGKLSVTNYGKIKGDIVSGGNQVKDKVVNKGAITGEVYLGDGNDTFQSKGGSAGRLHGGQGNDKFILGSKADKIVFDNTLNAATNVDTVKHFDHGTDKFYLDKTIFTNLTGPGPLLGSQFHKGGSAGDGSDHMIYKKGTGEVFYDPDGVGGTGQTLFAKVDPGTNLSAGDFIVIA